MHRRQDGFKAHLAVEPDTGIITDCALTKACGPDNHEAVVGLALLDMEPVVRGQALADRQHVGVIKPIPLRTPVPGGFSSDDFHIDFDARTVTCPAGHTRSITPSGSAGFGTRCRPCPLTAQCTTAKDGRNLTTGEHEHHLRAARVAARIPQWQNEYRRHRPWWNARLPG